MNARSSEAAEASGRLHITVRTAAGTGRTPVSAFDDALHKAGVADFNLIRLSSVVPPRSDVVVSDEPLPMEHGDRLYCVYAAGHAELRGESTWAGLGWAYDEDHGGLFVEHHSGSEASVRELVEMSMQDMARRRERDFGPVHQAVIGAHCVDQPVCALAIATFEVRGWDDARA
ncbi:pyruvoyl-dependent arginine decarboxylase [Nocardioides massiliensis]|uniref:Pyruvoyl-dependent arginine decarboxylase AaxB n=1 Tax=Nocardioides massiliensis TaxID=1325935 RepID=A0ABT9NNX7_9ACTN|nr:pyruvoyl-dependent arginine decarboxylase [Nocardioides massiliensis]MDP9821775.1 arginine decarboxylase [Nocardioides massiliensis]